MKVNVIVRTNNRKLSHANAKPIGYIRNRNVAERYCALQNNLLETNGKDNSYKYRILELNELDINEKELKDIDVKYYHQVVIDYKKTTLEEEFIRKEPDRYNFYFGEDKKTTITLYKHEYMIFHINSNSSDREAVENTALKMFKEIKYIKKKMNIDLTSSAKVFASENNCNLDIL